MFSKLTLSTVAIVLTFVAFYPYLHSIVRGVTRPHVFSWIIWSATTITVFFAQVAAQAGVGAWPVGAAGLITLGIAVFAYLKRADTTITRVDWWFFGAALSALPLWYLTADPLWAVLVLTVVDLLGFGPTLRKLYTQPYSESITLYALYAVRCVFVVLALEYYSVTTLLFPAAIGVACVLVIGLVGYRRRVVLQV